MIYKEKRKISLISQRNYKKTNLDIFRMFCMMRGKIYDFIYVNKLWLEINEINNLQM